MENFSLTHLSLVNSKKDILLDTLSGIPRDICIFSRFSALEIILPSSPCSDPSYIVLHRCGGGREAVLFNSPPLIKKE